MSFPRPFVALLVLTSPTHALQVGGAWELAHRYDYGRQGDRLGAAVAFAGDLDGDGVGDFAIGAPYAERNPNRENLGAVHVHSGATGERIRTVYGDARRQRFGSCIDRAGDVDGDGRDDLIVGGPQTNTGGPVKGGRVALLSGRTGTVIWERQGQWQDSFGFSVANCGDADLDGIDDVVVGILEQNNDAGGVHVYSGADGTLLHQVTGMHSGQTAGYAVSGAGDVDGDGRADFMFSAPDWQWYTGTLAGRGYVQVHSGADGSLIRTYSGEQGHDAFGSGLCRIPDLDGDGHDDHVIGALRAYVSFDTRGAVYAYSGRTGELLWKRNRVAVGNTVDFGRAVATVNDVDGDGLCEVVSGFKRHEIGAGEQEGYVALLSGRDGSILRRLGRGAANARFGDTLAGLPDLDTNGGPELLIGAPMAGMTSGSFTGATYLFAFAPFLNPDGDTISVSGFGGNEFQLDFPPSEAGMGYVLLASAHGVGPVHSGSVRVPLAMDPRLRAKLIRHAPRGVLDSEGAATVVLHDLPGLAPALGRTVNVVAVSYDPGTHEAREASASILMHVVP